MVDQILEEIVEERERQDKKWGPQRHNWPLWAVILGEEYGEVCKAICDIHFEEGKVEQVREELIQLAAVAVAITQHIDEVLGWDSVEGNSV